MVTLLYIFYMKIRVVYSLIYNMNLLYIFNSEYIIHSQTRNAASALMAIIQYSMSYHGNITTQHEFDIFRVGLSPSRLLQPAI